MSDARTADTTWTRVLADRRAALAVRLVTAAAVAAMVGFAFAQRWKLLDVSPYPLGIDGYFYPVQVRSLLEHGTLAYPSSPLTFWFMAPFAWATDPITGAKLGAALGGALIAIPAYGVGARLGRNRGAGLVAAALASASAGGAYLSIEFVKQGFGLTVGLAALWCILRALETRTRGRVIVAALAFVATGATHKLAAAIVALVVAPALVIEAKHHLDKRRLAYVLGGVVLALAGLLLFGELAPQRFASLHDLALLGDAFTETRRWSAPALVTEHLTLAFDHEAAIAGVLALAAGCILAAAKIAAVVRHRRAVAAPTATLQDRDYTRDIATSGMIIILALAIALPWLDVTDPQGIGFRLRVAAFVPLALCAAIVARGMISILAIWLHGSLATFIYTTTLAIVAVVIFVRGMQQDRIEGRVLTHPALAAAVMAAQDQIPANATIIVPERHILFMAAWYTRAPVSLRPEPIPYAQRVRMFGLVFIQGTHSPLDRALDAARADPAVAPPLGLHPRYRNGLVLVTEPTWDWLLAHVPEQQRTYYAAWPTI